MNYKIFQFLDVFSSSKRYHTAGWDSYFSGYLFIRIAHIFATKQYGQ